MSTVSRLSGPRATTRSIRRLVESDDPYFTSFTAIHHPFYQRGRESRRLLRTAGRMTH